MSDTVALTRLKSEAERIGDDRAVALWLFVVAAMIFVMVVIGGITRLTESGLSITEWKPISGVLPPLDDASWQREFDLYKQIPEFQKAEYVEITPLTGPARRFRRWAGFNWIFHPHLPNVGTSSEQCFAFHRAAVGHALNTGEMDVRAGYNEENAYYWARSSIFMGSALLQNPGIVLVTHDGSKYT